MGAIPPKSGLETSIASFKPSHPENGRSTIFCTLLMPNARRLMSKGNLLGMEGGPARPFFLSLRQHLNRHVHASKKLAPPVDRPTGSRIEWPHDRTVRPPFCPMRSALCLLQCRSKCHLLRLPLTDITRCLTMDCSTFTT